MPFAGLTNKIPFFIENYEKFGQIYLIPLAGKKVVREQALPAGSGKRHSLPETRNRTLITA
jgi:hypothetical protein